MTRNRVWRRVSPSVRGRRRSSKVMSATPNSAIERLPPPRAPDPDRAQPVRDEPGARLPDTGRASNARYQFQVAVCQHPVRGLVLDPRSGSSRCPSMMGIRDRAQTPRRILLETRRPDGRADSESLVSRCVRSRGHTRITAAAAA